MIAFAIFFLWIVVLMVTFTYFASQGKNFSFQLYLGSAAGYVGMLIYSGITWGWGYSAVYLSCATYLLWLAWKHRPPRNRKKVLKLIGAKAKAIRDKMVAAMPKPRLIGVPA